MGVYIKNIRMPKKGEKCPFNGYASRYGFVCFLDVEIACRSEDKRASRCPLIEVKAPHGRLIDADIVEEQLKEIEEITAMADIELGDDPEEGEISIPLFTIRNIHNQAKSVIEAEVE